MDRNRLNILLVEDNEDDYVIVRDLLRDIDATRFVLEWAGCYADGLQAIQAHRHDLILLDFRLSDGTGLELLQETQAIASRAPVIFMTGQGDHDIDVQVMQAGAADYLVKDRLDADLLERAIRYAVERQKSAEALRASEDRYRTFVESSTEGIWRFELEQPLPTDRSEIEQIAHLVRYAYVAECNEAMARIYGFEQAAELLGARFGTLLSTGEANDDNYLRRLIHNQYRLVTAEAFVSDRHGQPKYVLHNLIGVVENGLLYRIWGSQNDITERKRAENAQAQLAAIVEASADAIISTTLDGLIVTWNKGAEAMYGYTAQEVTGQLVSCLIPADYAGEMGGILECIQRSERVAPFETVRLHKDGRRIDVSLAVSPMMDALGQVIGSSSIARDISDQKRAAMRLRLSEANMAAAQRIAHFGSWQIELGSLGDINANPLRWSDETFRIFGYEPGSVPVTNDLFFQAVLPEEQPRIQQTMAAAVAERKYASFVHRVRRPDGEERIVREMAQFFEGEEAGQSPRIVGTVHDITEQQQAEETIRFNALLLSQVRNAVISTDLEGKITYWNNFAETLYQWKSEEVIGKNIMDLMASPQNRESAEQILQQLRDTGNWEGEFLVQRKDGSAFPAYVVDTLLQDMHGVATGFVGVSIDITERKRAEEARHLREQEFEMLVENAPDIVSRYDRQFRHLYVNRVITQVTGLPISAFIGKTHSEIGIPHHLQADWQAVLEDVFAGGMERETEFEFQTPGGTRYYHSRLVPERAPDGRIRSVLNIARDITERKKAEEELERTSREILTAWESMTDAFFIVNARWQVTYINSQGGLLLQKNRAEMIGISLWDTFPEAVGSTFYREYHRALEQQVSVGFEEFYSPLGKWFEVHVYPSALGLSVYFRDISDRKNAEAERDRVEEALRASEHKLRLMLDSGRFGTFELDLITGRYLEISNMGRDQFALPSDSEVFMRDFFQIVHPEDRAEMQAVVARASAAQDADFSSDYRVILPNGSVRWISVHGTLTYEDAGRPVRMLGVTQDITERKQAEEALVLRDKAIQASSNGIVVADVRQPDMPIVFVNPAFERITNYSAGEVLGRNCRFLQGTDQDQPDLSLIRAAMKDGLSIGAILRNYCKDGTLFWNELFLSPIYDAHGTLTHYVGVQNDVTDRKQAEEERDRFFTLSLDMLAIISSDGYIKRLNPAFEATLGFSDAELMAKPFLEFVHPDDIPATLVEVTNIMTGAQITGFENRYLCQDGSYKWMRWMCAPYGDLWYCVAHDVTAIKQAAAALQQANDDLEARVEARTQALQWAMEESDRANAAKSDFLSRMSHELRTPMNSILGFAQIMEMDAPGDKQAVRIGHIIKAGQHLLQLINEVLDLARVESGRLQLSSEPVSLGVCLQSAVDIIRPLCEPRGQRIICNIDECTPLYVQADQQRLAQVLINLLSNATKYNRDDGVILVQCEQVREGWHRVSINDSGAGIAAEQLAKLFQPFERLGADGSAIEGTGLGLALSKRLIELMGGVISVESVVGSGSTFTIDLPCAESPGQGVETTASRPVLPEGDGRQYLILYIEDNLANLQLIEHVLADHPQYQLLSAQTGLIGLDMARERLPSLILLDLHLPGLQGDEVLVRLQADPVTRDIPVVIVSADATSSQIRRLLAAGAADYLTKPLDVRLLNEVLHKILQPQTGKDG